MRISGGLRTLDLGLDIVDGVRRLHLKGDSLAREGLYENLHGGLEGEVSDEEQEKMSLLMRKKHKKWDAYLDNPVLSSSVVVAEGWLGRRRVKKAERRNFKCGLGGFG